MRLYIYSLLTFEKDDVMHLFEAISDASFLASGQDFSEERAISSPEVQEVRTGS